MKLSSIVSLFVLYGWLLGCSGATSNPSTTDRTDFAPPGFLFSVTGDEQIELRWSALNVEDEFRGYYVFGAKTSLSSISSGITVPSGIDVTKVGVQRCKDNSDFFEAFGLPESDADCGGEKIEIDETGGFINDDPKMQMLAGSDADSLANFLSCSEAEDKTVAASKISLPVDPPALGTQRCTVTKAYDASTGQLEDIVNGESYVFFVVAAMNNDLNEISWTSNAVEDVPSDTAVSTTVTLRHNDQSSSANPAEKFTLNSDGVSFTQAGISTCTTAICRLSPSNTTTGNAIYIARDSGTSFPQRIWISASSASGNTIKLVPRGPQTYDPVTGTRVGRVGEDQAVAIPSGETFDSNSVYAAGTKFAVYGNQVFDFVINNSAGLNYGKVVILDVNYTTPSSNTSDVTIAMQIIMQTKVGSVSYFQ